MGSEKIAVRFNSVRLSELLKEKGSINYAAQVAGYSHPSTFRTALRKGEISPLRLKKLCDYVGADPWDLVEDESEKDFIFINAMIEKGMMSVEDKRDRKELSPVDQAFITIFEALGYEIAPLTDGTADFSGKRYSGKVPLPVVYELMEKTKKEIEKDLMKIENDTVFPQLFKR